MQYTDKQIEKINEIAEIYNIDTNKVKELFLDYPMLMERSVAFYLEYKIGKEIFDKHWLCECIRTLDDFCSFGGYRTFENLMSVVGKIEESIGTVVKVYNKKYQEGSLVVLEVVNKDKTFLVTLGSDTVSKKQRVDLVDDNTPEQKLLKAIFGDELKKEPHQEHFIHNEYVCEINTEKACNIEDIIQLLAALSTHNIRRECGLNKKSNVYYLADSNYIKPCSFDVIDSLENDKNWLNVAFYKVEPAGNGRIRVKYLNSQIDEDDGDIFNDLVDEE